VNDVAAGAAIGAAGALCGALIALCGSLGAQIISTRASLRLKQAELLYVQKRESYEKLIQSANEFNANPTDKDCYVRLQSTIQYVIIICPPTLSNLLQNTHSTKSLMYVANLMRFAPNQGEINRLQIHQWHDVIEHITSAIREDLSAGLNGESRRGYR
jgi:hypothetical protein